MIQSICSIHKIICEMHLISESHLFLKVSPIFEHTHPIIIESTFSFHSVHSILFLLRGLNLLPNFQKGELDRTLGFRGGVVGKMGVTFLREGFNFYIKNKLKSKIFNGKKVDKQKCFSPS